MSRDNERSAPNLSNQRRKNSAERGGSDDSGNCGKDGEKQLKTNRSAKNLQLRGGFSLQ